MPGRINAVVGGLFDGIKNAFKTAVNWIITKWNNLELKIGGGSILGVDIPSITLSTPNIPLLAKGGIIDMAGLALVGERGPEILSLPKGAQVSPLPTGGGYAGGPITIHNEIMVNVGGAAGSADPAAIASAVQTRVDAAFRELVRAIRAR